MTLDAILDKLSKESKALEGFGVKSLSVFGSVARGDATAQSDVDLLVEFEEPVGFFELARLQRYLERTLEAKVDLVTPGGLRASMRERVLREAVRAA